MSLTHPPIANPVYSVIAHAADVACAAAWEAHTDAMVEPTDSDARQHARNLAAKARVATDLLSRTCRYL